MNLTSLQARKIYQRFGWGLAISLVTLIGSAFVTLLATTEKSVFFSPKTEDLAPYVALASVLVSFVTLSDFLYPTR
jgi:hypothetical protein